MTERAGHTWIERPHLLGRAAEARIVLLDAPGGWGKTTLAEQLLAARGVATARVRLDGTTGTDAFAARLRRGLRRAGISDLATVGEHGDPESFADALLSALAQRAEPVAVFVDEAHLLVDEAVAWLRGVADDLSSPHSLVVAGRTLARPLVHRPRHDVVRLTIDDLRFDLDETARVLGVDRDAARPVRDRSDGWPTAIGLASRSGIALAGADAQSLDFAALIDDVLGTARATLAPLAWLPQLDAAVAGLVAGPDAFEQLMASGLPVTTSNDWVVVAEPVRDALRPPHPPPATVCADVADRYDLQTASAFLVACGHLDALADQLAARHWTELQELGTNELDALLRMLGSERLAARPAVHLGAARAAEMRDMAHRQRYIRDGLAAAPPHSHAAHALEAERIRDVVRTAVRDVAHEAGNGLLAVLDDGELAARGRTLLSIGIAHAYRSSPEDLARAGPAFDEAAGLFRVLGEQRWEADALNRLAVMVNYHGGRLALAAEQQASSLALLPAGSVDWAIGMTYYCEMLDYLGRSVEAEAAAREAWEVGRRLGDSRVTAYGAWSAAVTAAHTGDLDGTRGWLAEAERHPGAWFDEIGGQEFLAFGSDLLGGLGDREGADAYRQRCAARVGHGGTAELLDVLDGRLESMYGDPARALAIFDRLEGEPYATIRTKWVRFLFRALSAKRLGDRAAATRAVERCLALVEQMGVADLPQRHEPLLVQMLSDVWPGGPVASGAGRMRVVMLGGFNVLNGVEVVTPAAGNAAMLVKLLALRRVMTTEQVIDALWPDVDVVTGRARVRNLLNRVRNQTGSLVERRGETIELAAGVDVDIDRFESGAAGALAADPAERIGLARLALGAYTGDLLPGDAYEDWAAGPRERLRRRYLSLVDIVADDAIARGDLDEGVRLLDLAIEAEPLDERRYAVAARALVDQGRRTAARDVVHRATAALGELGLPLGDDLTAIGRMLDVG